MCYLYLNDFISSRLIAMSSTKRLKKNNTLNLKDKTKLLDEFEHDGKTRTELAVKWKVALSTVYNIIGKKDEIRSNAARPGVSRRKRIKVPKFDTIEKTLFKDFKVARKARPNLPIDGSWLKLQAHIIKHLFPPEFSFKDFVDADKDLITYDQFDPTNGNCHMGAGDAELMPENDDVLTLDDEEESDCKITNKQAMDAVSILLKHCNQSEIGTPEASTVFSNYLDRLIVESFTIKKPTDIRSYFPIREPQL